jgi:hypothetical protein
LHKVANSAYLGGFLFSGLLCVAPYCVPGGVRVVSIDALLLHDPARSRHAPEGLQHLFGHVSIQITLDSYSHWIASMGRSTADGMDEALG